MSLPVPVGTNLPQTSPRIGVALGGGGARGLSHIVVLEVLDELGLKPVALSGTSIGAIIGAAYASGMSGKDIRAYMLDMLGDRSEVVRRLLKARVGRFSHLLKQGLTNPVLLDGEVLLDAFLPSSVPPDFAQLRIGLSISATDFHSGEEVVFAEGPLIPAIAASMAIPGVLRPVTIGTRVLVDGGAVNPVPNDLLTGKADLTIAVNIIDGAAANRTIDLATPEPADAVFGTITLMMRQLADIRLAAQPPSLLVVPPISGFRSIDFFRAKEIFAACAPMKDPLKRRIEQAMMTSPAELASTPARPDMTRLKKALRWLPRKASFRPR